MPVKATARRNQRPITSPRSLDWDSERDLKKKKQKKRWTGHVRETFRNARSWTAPERKVTFPSGVKYRWPTAEETTGSDEMWHLRTKSSRGALRKDASSWLCWSAFINHNHRADRRDAPNFISTNQATKRCHLMPMRDFCFLSPPSEHNYLVISASLARLFHLP